MYSGLNGDFQRDMSMSKSLEPVNITLFGKRVLTDIINDPEMRSSWITQVSLSPMANVLIKYKQEEDTEKEAM